MDDRRRDIALFRYSLVREAADARLSRRERGELVRSLAAREHLGPSGEPVRVSRDTLDRWIRAWRQGGFGALLPAPRPSVPRTPEEVLGLACDLKREGPRRTAAQIAEILATTKQMAVSSRTLQRHFARLGLNRAEGRAPGAYGRFEADECNELWTGDALHGPAIGALRSILFCFIDDHSRLLPGYRWGSMEDSLRLEAALRKGLAARGVPKGIYVDNGSPFISKRLLRACATLGIKLSHSAPGRPAGRGKIERAFRTVREQFLVEVEVRGVADLDELNRLFQAWVEVVYHRRPHTETGQAPIERFLAPGPPALPTPAELREAFLWSEHRIVTKTATVSLFGNAYEVEQALAGAKVELVFDPFDLAEIRVRYQGREMGRAAPRVIARHVHPEARTEAPPEAKPRTGIDYLSVIESRFTEHTKRGITYGALGGEPPEAPDESSEREVEAPQGSTEEEAS
jgi:putative transposase